MSKRKRKLKHKKRIKYEIERKNARVKRMKAMRERMEKALAKAIEESNGNLS